ncbi:hypothetical protein [Legionella fairfieldensis]|uniref:hypothetical protein n=1 Tax=Legionella fairfieldensis TaxID=45064 RepID=UPI00048D746E|nr:hypothetical protein [Legionella fairfieldensis]
MNLLKTLTITLLIISAPVVAASPSRLVTHNTTNVRSNTYFAGYIPSSAPAQAHDDGLLDWPFVKMACYGHTSATKCPAVIKVAIDTPNPVDLGKVTIDIETGDITPKSLSLNGYTLVVNGPGEMTLTKKRSPFD